MTGQFDAEIVIIYTELVLVERKHQCEMCFAYYKVFKEQLAIPVGMPGLLSEHQQRLRKGKEQHTKIC